MFCVGVVLCCAVLCYAALCCVGAVLVLCWCGVVLRLVLRCAVLCCAVLCCTALCVVVRFCAEGAVTKRQKAGMSTHGYR